MALPTKSRHTVSTKALQISFFLSRGDCLLLPGDLRSVCKPFIESILMLENSHRTEATDSQSKSLGVLPHTYIENLANLETKTSINIQTKAPSIVTIFCSFWHFTYQANSSSSKSSKFIELNPCLMLAHT